MQAILVLALFATAATALSAAPRGELRGRVLLNENTRDGVVVDRRREIPSRRRGVPIVDRYEPEMTIEVKEEGNKLGHLHYNFRRDFNTYINPRNESSHFEWLRVRDPRNTKRVFVADSATILRDGLSAIDLVSIPYKNYVPIDRTRSGLLNNIEAAIVHKHRFVVEEGKKLKVRATFAVKLFNVESHPFNNTAVSNATDDPTLACAGMSLVAHGEHGLVFSIVATDKGIWAVYERNRMELVEHPERKDKIFMVFTRIGDRKTHDEVIDAGITYDRRQGKVLYKLDNTVVHVIERIGELDLNQTGTYGFDFKNRRDLVRVEPKELSVMFGLLSFLDAVDPNAPINSVRNMRLTHDMSVYDPRARFADVVGLKKNNLYGQGAALTLLDVDIELKESTGYEREGRQEDGEDEGDEGVVPVQEDEEEGEMKSHRTGRIFPLQDEDVEREDEGVAPGRRPLVPPYRVARFNVPVQEEEEEERRRRTD